MKTREVQRLSKSVAQSGESEQSCLSQMGALRAEVESGRSALRKVTSKMGAR